MRHCYDCGIEVRGAGQRRVVETGRSRRVYSGRRRTSVSHSKSEGCRTLCESCAGSRDQRAAFEARLKFVFICGAAALLGIGYFSQPKKDHESLAVAQQAVSAPPPIPSRSDEPTETASINAQVLPVHHDVNAPLTLSSITSPPVSETQGLLDPNFPPDATRVQDRLRFLGFPISDPRGVWSKTTDLAIGRFRRSRGLRSNWRWDVSTQTALFAQAR
jgi:hypothetical protein